MRNLPIESTDMLSGPVLLAISDEPGHVIDLCAVIEFDDNPADDSLLVVFAAPCFAQDTTSPSDGPHALVLTGESRILALAYQRFHLNRATAWLSALASQA